MIFVIGLSPHFVYAHHVQVISHNNCFTHDSIDVSDYDNSIVLESSLPESGMNRLYSMPKS